MLDLRDPNELAAHNHLLLQESAGRAEDAAARWVDDNPLRAADVESAFFAATDAEQEQIASALRKQDHTEAGRLLAAVIRRARIDEKAEQLEMDAEDHRG